MRTTTLPHGPAAAAALPSALPAEPKDPLARAAAATARGWQAGDVIDDEQGRPLLWVLHSGWAARVRLLADGRRQIVRLLLPQDLGPSASPASVGCVTVALTPVKVIALGAREELLASADPQVRLMMQSLARHEQRELMSQLVRLGAMPAYERTGHALLEMFERLARVGLVRGDTMPMPMTQEMLGDLLGLSVVHVNRTLQQLRRQGLIVTKGRQVSFPDLEGLAQACGYERELRAPARGEVRSFAGETERPQA